MSKIIVTIEFAGMTHKDYDAVCHELTAQNKLYNKYRPSHVAFEKEGKWCVIDVWESKEAFEEFAATGIGPIFGKLGFGQPQFIISPVHNFVGLKAEEFISA